MPKHLDDDTRAWLPPPQEVLTASQLLPLSCNFATDSSPPWLEPILTERIGLEFFFVVDIENDHGRRVRLQLTGVLIDRSVSVERWVFIGNALRKDGSIGVLREIFYARCATFQRRHLDGSWQPLRPE